MARNYKYIYLYYTRRRFVNRKRRTAMVGRGRFRHRVETMDDVAGVFGRWVRWPGKYQGERDRLYTQERTFWAFLGQALSPNGSCQEAVTKCAVHLAREGKVVSPDSGAYCRARARLPLERIEAVHQDALRQLDRGETPKRLWYGRRVNVVDGSSISMPDTPENQKKYPQPHGQKPGCGFPVMRLVAVFSLVTGAIRNCEKGALSVSERALFHRLWDFFKPGEVVLADRGFSSYADFYLLARRRVDCVMRLHARRTVGVTLLKKLGRHDGLVLWHKPQCRPKWITPEQWLAVPNTLKIRHITVHVTIPGFRVHTIQIATTLLDHRAFPPTAFEELYRRRWLAELFLRDIKISMRMDVLRCKTPDMVEKELAVHILAYNLIRITIWQAACEHAVHPFEISFKSTITHILQWAPVLADPRLANKTFYNLLRQFLQFIARSNVPQRPNRVEPRARKRRPKGYPLLNTPRRLFKDTPHRNRYQKP
jgi:hypothetical protein